MLALRDAQVEEWLKQEVLAKHKRVGGTSTRYYAARTNGPPSSVSEEKVRIVFATSAVRTIQEVARCSRKAKDVVGVHTLYSGKMCSAARARTLPCGVSWLHPLYSMFFCFSVAYCCSCQYSLPHTFPSLHRYVQSTYSGVFETCRYSYRKNCSLLGTRYFWG